MKCSGPAAFFFAALTLPRIAQTQDLRLRSDKRPKSYVAYVAEAHTIPAGRSGTIELHFKVLDNFHVNSHKPKTEFLVPTNLSMEPTPGIRAAPLEYPDGTAYSFSFEPGEMLDVYTGPFTVKMPVIASAGTYRVAGTLRYQACDRAACYPAKMLPVEVLFTAR